MGYLRVRIDGLRFLEWMIWSGEGRLDEVGRFVALLMLIWFYQNF